MEDDLAKNPRFSLSPEAQAEINKHVEQMEKAGASPSQISNWKAMHFSMHLLKESAPPGGYAQVIRKKWKRYFRPKTNWNRINALLALAMLIITAWMCLK